MNQKQFTFANEYLRHSNKIVAYTLAYGNNDNYTAVESAANRLLRTQEVADYIRQTRDSIRHQLEQEIKEKCKEELLTVYEKRLLIKKLLFGEVKVEVIHKGKNCIPCSHFMSPTIPMAIQLLREDSMLAGHYPHKWAQAHNKTHSQSNSHSGGQQNEETPILFLGGDIGRKAEGFNLPIGVVDSQAPQSHNKSQQPTAGDLIVTNEKTLIPQQNESPLQGERGTARAEDSQSHNKSQQPTAGELIVTNEKTLIPQQNESPLQGERGTTHAEDSQSHNKTQQTGATHNNHSLSMNHINKSSGQTPNTPQQNTPSAKIPCNITHAGLRKLLAKTKNNKTNLPAQLNN